jgi:hypothetical protein
MNDDTFEITNAVRIQNDEHYWYTVEDWHLDVGGNNACTISYWERSENQDKRVEYMCFNEKEALKIADAIYKLLKNK